MALKAISMNDKIVGVFAKRFQFSSPPFGNLASRRRNTTALLRTSGLKFGKANERRPARSIGRRNGDDAARSAGNNLSQLQQRGCRSLRNPRYTARGYGLHHSASESEHLSKSVARSGPGHYFVV